MRCEVYQRKVLPATGCEVICCLCEVGMVALKDTEKYSTMKDYYTVHLKIMVEVVGYNCNLVFSFIVSRNESQAFCTNSFVLQGFNVFDIYFSFFAIWCCQQGRHSCMSAYIQTYLHAYSIYACNHT